MEKEKDKLYVCNQPETCAGFKGTVKVMRELLAGVFPAPAKAMVYLAPPGKRGKHNKMSVTIN